MPTPIAVTEPSARKPVESLEGAREGLLIVIIGVVDEEHVQPVNAEPLETAFHRTHDTVVAEVEVRLQRALVAAVERESKAVGRILSGEPASCARDVTSKEGRATLGPRDGLAKHTGDLLERGHRTQEPADLRRDDQLVARQLGQCGSDASLGEARPVLGGGVDQSGAEPMRRLDDGPCLVVIHGDADLAEHVAERDGPDAETRRLEGRLPDSRHADRAGFSW